MYSEYKYSITKIYADEMINNIRSMYHDDKMNIII